MNIIVVSNDLARTRTFTINRWQAAFAALLVVMLTLSMALALQFFTLRHAAQIKSPYLQEILLPLQRQEAERIRAYLRDNLNALGAKVGQMQAQLLRLNALGERLASTAGIKPQEFSMDTAPGMGGAVPAGAQRDLSLDELVRQIASVSSGLDAHSDGLEALEAILIEDQLRKRLLPSARPLDAGWHSSNFGWRLDPFTGRRAFHEGVDFVAPVGTPVLAAASGVVVTAENHSQYGKMVELDHGNGLVTRYAHASELLVGLGDVVLRGQPIAKVGDTGRSTGPHLHFEVRQNGVPRNPAQYLNARS